MQPFLTPTQAVTAFAIVFAVELLGFMALTRFAEPPPRYDEIEKPPAQPDYQTEIDSLRQELDELRSRPPQTVVRESTPRAASEPPPTNTVKSIVQAWRSSVVYVECIFSTQRATQGGSGTLIRDYFQNYYVLTNRHVATLDDGFVFPDRCIVTLPDDRASRIEVPQGRVHVTVGEDSAKLFLTDPSFSTDLSQAPPPPSDYVRANSISSSRICYYKDVSLGEAVVVIGYPTIGTTNDVTITEGIISGFEGRRFDPRYPFDNSLPVPVYYVTSAKIDSGNSGGAAILLEDNCFLGMPTFSIIGQSESFGRILGL